MKITTVNIYNIINKLLFTNYYLIYLNKLNYKFNI